MLIQAEGILDYLIVIVLGFAPWIGGLCFIFWMIHLRDSKGKK